MSFSPDGEVLASTGFKSTVRLWKKDGTPLKILERLNKIDVLSISALSFSPDGEVIASASDGGKVRLWQRDGTPLKKFKGHESRVTVLSFSPDGEVLVSASRDGTVRLWSWQLHELVHNNCNWLRDYLRTNVKLGEDRHLCDGIGESR